MVRTLSRRAASLVSLRHLRCFATLLFVIMLPRSGNSQVIHLPVSSLKVVENRVMYISAAAFKTGGASLVALSTNEDVLSYSYTANDTAFVTFLLPATVNGIDSIVVFIKSASTTSKNAGFSIRYRSQANNAAWSTYIQTPTVSVSLGTQAYYQIRAKFTGPWSFATDALNNMQLIRDNSVTNNLQSVVYVQGVAIFYN